MNALPHTDRNPAMRDRPPILTFLLLFTAMLAVVTALAALNEPQVQAEPTAFGARAESHANPTQDDQ